MESKVLRNEYYKDSGTIDYEEEARGAVEGGKQVKIPAKRIIRGYPSTGGLYSIRPQLDHSSVN